MSNQNNDDVELKSNNKSDSDLNQKKSNSTKKLNRNTNKKIFGGVCSGFANYFGISVTLMRILWLILSIFFCVGIFIYMILWVAIPDKRFSKSDIDKSDNDSNREKSNSTKVVKDWSIIFPIIMIGCFIGFGGGWKFGQSLSREGIIFMAWGIFGFVLGGGLAAIIGVIIVRNKNN